MGFKSLFTDKEIWRYYGVIQGLLSYVGMIAKIFMVTGNKFTFYDIYHFPTFRDNEVVMLQGKQIHFLDSR